MKLTAGLKAKKDRIWYPRAGNRKTEPARGRFYLRDSFRSFRGCGKGTEVSRQYRKVCNL